MSEQLYYIEQYTDEVMPCRADLASWAEWLSKPDPEWGREKAAVHGAQFNASTMEMLDDITATFRGGQWRYDPPPERADFFALRYGPGMGWSPDTIADTIDGALNAYKDAYVGGPKPEEGEQEIVAVCCSTAACYRRLEFRYADGTPELVDLGPVQ